MKKLLLLLALVFWLLPAESEGATGCGYPQTLDTFTNVTTGTILTAADYNKLLCAVEKLESSFRLPNYTVATLPSSPAIGQGVYVTDAIDDSTCTTGGGTSKNVCIYNGTGWIISASGGGGAGAPTGATYITSTTNGTLSAEFALGSLATGLLRNTTTTGIPTIATEGTHYYAPGGTDVAVADGGTGASTAAAARTNLGLAIGTDVYTQRTFTDHANVLSIANPNGVAGAPGFTIANSLIDGSNRFAADAGSSDAYAACPLSVSTMSTPAIVDGSIHSFRANTANTGAATLSLCGITARSIVKVTGGITTALADDDIRVGQNVMVQANNGNNTFQMQSTLGNAPAGGAGTPGGADTQCQFNDAGAFGGEAGCTYNKTTDVLATVGGFAAGTGNSTILASSGLTADRTVTNTVDGDGNLGVTTGTRTVGDLVKFADSQGRMARAGPAYKVAQFMLGAEDGSVLVDTNDQPTIFFNDWSQGITTTRVWCESDAGTPTINLLRDDGSPANILSSSLTCSTTGATSTTFSGTENQIGDGHRVDLAVVSAGGTAKRITISFRYTMD